MHNLFEHLACCDLALVQGGLSTCMELVATRRPFLSFPLRAALRAMRARPPPAAQLRRRPFARLPARLTPETLAEQALATMHAPVRYRPVETDGAARAARRIAEVLENRWWAQR